MTVIKQEKLVLKFIVIYVHSGVFLCFYKIVPRYSKISNFAYPVPEITENASPYMYSIHIIITLLLFTFSVPRAGEVIFREKSEIFFSFPIFHGIAHTCM